MEGVVHPMTWDGFPLDFRAGFRMMRTPGLGWVMISGLNMFVEKILPSAIVRDLPPGEMDHYRVPYPTARSRKPDRVWPRELPIDGSPADVHEIVNGYSHWLGKTQTPMLMFHATPGGTMGPKEVASCRQTIQYLEVVDIGKGIHFLKEDNPHLIGEKLAEWSARLPA